MNIRRFKKIIIIYMALFLLACLLVPYNAYFNSDDKQHINLGFVYRPAFEGAYDNQVSLFYRSDGTYQITSNGYFSGYIIKYNNIGDLLKGSIKYDLNNAMLIAELLGLTVVFSGASYILCKNESYQ